MILELYLYIPFDEIKFPLISLHIFFVMLREVYTAGRLRDFLSSKGCRGIRRKKRKFAQKNRAYGIIEFVDKKQ